MDSTANLLPPIIAALNGLSLVFLILGMMAIRAKIITYHRMFMMAAFVCSVFFLAVYLLHHYKAGSIPYPAHDWTRSLYFIILIPHVILAVVIVPFIVLAFRYAMMNDIPKHKRIVRFLFPAWVYVSVTGLVVYYMLYVMNS